MANKTIREFVVKSNKEVREAAFNSHIQCPVCKQDVAKHVDASGKLGVMRMATNGIERRAICPDCMKKLREDGNHGVCKSCNNLFTFGTYFGDEFTKDSPNCPGCVAKELEKAKKQAEKDAKQAEKDAKNIAKAQKYAAKAGASIATPTETVVLPTQPVAVDGSMNPYVSKQALKQFVNSLIDLVYPEG